MLFETMPTLIIRSSFNLAVGMTTLAYYE